MAPLANPKEERTFVMVKPDGVLKGLVGQVLKRFEQRGLKIVALELFQPTLEQVDAHYPKDDAWLKRLGEKTLSTYEKYGYDPVKDFDTKDAVTIGKEIRKWLTSYLLSGPMVKMVIEGTHAIDMVRKICGPTLPYKAEMGTIRGDFSNDSPALANAERRAVQNVVHASETPEEAAHEMKHWFGDAKFLDYKRHGE